MVSVHVKGSSIEANRMSGEGEGRRGGVCGVVSSGKHHLKNSEIRVGARARKGGEGW